MGVRKDLFFTKKICDNYYFYDYSRIYFNTNEKLDELYSEIDFNGKDVFCVLASSDQYFKIKQLGVRSIDTFDKNKLTYYYYFYRMWSIKYLNNLYPTELIKNDYQSIGKLLSKVEVNSKEEKAALTFWRSLLDKKVLFSSLFYIDKNTMLNYDTSSINTNLDARVNFINVDLFRKNTFKLKYDIIVLSNILEWTDGDARCINRLKNNINKLLTDNGIVLCSRVSKSYYYVHPDEKTIFSDIFEYSDLNNNLGFVYKKKL